MARQREWSFIKGSFPVDISVKATFQNWTKCEESISVTWIQNVLKIKRKTEFPKLLHILTFQVTGNDLHLFQVITRHFMSCHGGCRKIGYRRQHFERLSSDHLRQLYVRVCVLRPSSVCVCVTNFTSDLLCLYLLQLWTDFDVQGV